MYKPLFFKVLISFSLLLSFLPFSLYAEQGVESVEKSNASAAEEKDIPLEDVQRFSNALTQIKKYYVKPVDDKELFDNAIRGMLGGLDPHSGYLDEEDFKDLQTATSGEFGGLGIEVTMEDGVIRVVSPLVDAPAYKAGIKAGDYIIKLNTQLVQGMSLKQAVDMMRGESGSTLDLTVLRKGENKPLKFAVIREKITIKSVKSNLFEKNYGYVRLTQFQALTSEDLRKAILALKKDSNNQLKGLILDLRNNPGGLLESAIQVSDAFLDTSKSKKPETIVYTKGRLPGSKFIALANPGDILDNAPLVVLINNGSASAAEIVAGALKDNKRALIIGTKSFGKGSVQTVLPLDDKRAIKLTTALYYTPAGTSIQATGITPHIVVEEMALNQEKKEPSLLELSESDLKGHLLNDSEEKKVKAIELEDNRILYQDYQLYAALTILKGLVFAKNS